MNLRVLSEDKTETRRIIKPRPLDVPRLWKDPIEGVTITAHVEGKENLYEYFCPYQVGDILYVRETWQEVFETEYENEDPRGYVNIRELLTNFDEIPKVEAGISTNCSSARMAPRMKYYVFKASKIEYADPDNKLLWRPSIHMPKEAARTFLEVVDIDIQPIQDITIEQILREGVDWIKPPPICQTPIVYPESFPEGFDNWDFDRREDWIRSTARARYIGWQDYANNMFNAWEKLWDSTIPKKNLNIYGYAANPWVWVIKFRKLKEKIDIHSFDVSK